MAKYERIMRRVEEEEGQPFWTVVRDYAEMGCSRQETSKLLGFKFPCYFLGLLRAHPEQDIQWPGPGQSVLFDDLRRRCRTPGSADHQRLCRASKVSVAKNTRRYWIDDVYDSISGHLARLGADIQPQTVLTRMKRGWTIEAAVKTRKIDARVSGRRSAAVRKLKQQSEAA